MEEEKAWRGEKKRGGEGRMLQSTWEKNEKCKKYFIEKYLSWWSTAPQISGCSVLSDTTACISLNENLNYSFSQHLLINIFISLLVHIFSLLWLGAELIWRFVVVRCCDRFGCRPCGCVGHTVLQFGKQDARQWVWHQWVRGCKSGVGGRWRSFSSSLSQCLSCSTEIYGFTTRDTMRIWIDSSGLVVWAERWRWHDNNVEKNNWC